MQDNHSFAEYLELLATIGHDFATSLDLDRTLQKALVMVAGFLNAEAASLFLLERNDRELVCRACFGPINVNGLRVSSHEGVVGRSVQSNECQMVRDVRLDPDFVSAVDHDTGFSTRSILCAPLSVKDRQVGALELLNKRTDDGLFTDQDFHALKALASFAALAILNAGLTHALIEQERLRKEVELAAEIQRNLLPKVQSSNLPVYGMNVAARDVSGDFYDIFPVADGRVCFAVGDVAGKGVNAALLMAKTSSLFRCLGKTMDHPGKLLGRINTELCETGTRGMFVTMVCGIYDPSSGVVRFANAGHEPPLHRDCHGRYHAFEAQAPPLGIQEDVVPPGGYPVNEVALEGGILTVFTDGVTEGRLEDGRVLGVEGFKALVEGLRDLEPTERLRAIVGKLNRPGMHLRDDLTILTVEDSGGRSTQ